MRVDCLGEISESLVFDSRCRPGLCRAEQADRAVALRLEAGGQSHSAGLLVRGTGELRVNMRQIVRCACTGPPLECSFSPALAREPGPMPKATAALPKPMPRCVEEGRRSYDEGKRGELASRQASSREKRNRADGVSRAREMKLERGEGRLVGIMLRW